MSIVKYKMELKNDSTESYTQCQIDLEDESGRKNREKDEESVIMPNVRVKEDFEDEIFERNGKDKDARKQ